MTTVTTTMLDAALSYAAHGWYVFPCRPRDKKPLTEHGFKDATAEADQIRVWWSKTPDANIGVDCGRSGLVVVDCDPKNGGTATLDALLAEHGRFPDTVTAISGSGGTHHFFSDDQHAKLRPSLGAGVDLQGLGHYIIVPPSLHPNGNRYEWEASSSPDTTPLAPLPDWIRKLAAARDVATPPTATPDTAGGRIPEGERNATLASLAGGMRHRGFTGTAIIAALIAENAARCTPPLPEAEVRAIAKSIAQYAPAQGGNGVDPSGIAPAWPDPPDGAAYYGLAGDIVRAIEPHSEADPVALLVQTLVAFGSVAGREPHFIAEADYHACNLYCILVGVTAKGRKGSSWGHVRRVFSVADPAWVTNRIQSGLSSGEGLIFAVRDPVEELGKDGAKSITDPGETDKRLLVFESEYANVLRVMDRDGNTLSPILRQAWDTGNLATLTKNSRTRATGAHLSLVGHITRDELRRYLHSTEAANGFANRHLFLCVRRSKFLPEGGHMQDADLAPLISRLGEAIAFARNVKEIQKDNDAKELWATVYNDLSEGKPGLLGAVTSRGEAQVMRLAAIYALLDMSPVISRRHMEAALAIWEYAEASARYIFGDAVGDDTADAILRALRASAGGMTRTDISALFGRNKAAGEISRGLTLLLEYGLLRAETDASEATGGRPAQRWAAV